MDEALGGVNPEDAAVPADSVVDPGTPPIAALTALETSSHDPLVAIFLGEKLRELAKTADAALRARLLDCVEKTWGLYFGLPQERTLAFDLGTVMQVLGEWSAADRLYRRSLEINGEDAQTHFNLGICARATGAPSTALANFARALELEPDLEPAREQYERVITSTR